jgi:V8-like Glu-specific endopeptidase
MCSGTLVGPREILTAAHCIAEGPGAAGTRVYVANSRRSVESAWYHSQYVPSQSPSESARFDLGMLILSEPVTNMSPIPVLRGRRITRGTKILIAGYGSNERSDDPNRSFRDNFKVGLSRVILADGNHLFASHRAFSASACSGDSGGPAIIAIGKRSLAVAGTLSAGINVSEGGKCYLRGDGTFVEVDLQSVSSRAFLRSFPGVRYVRANSRR